MSRFLYVSILYVNGYTPNGAVFDLRTYQCGISRHCYTRVFLPCVGSGVVRIDPLYFLVRCFTRRLNQVLYVLYLSIFYCVVY